jgi:hypothetical protein
MPGSGGRSFTGRRADEHGWRDPIIASEKKPGRGGPLPGVMTSDCRDGASQVDDQLQQPPPPQQSSPWSHRPFRPSKIPCRKHFFSSQQEFEPQQDGAGAAQTGAAQTGAGAQHFGAGAQHFGAGAQHLGAGAQHFGAGAQHRGAGAQHFGAGAQHFGAGAQHLGAGAQQSSWPWPNRPNRPASALLLPAQQIIKAADRVIHFIPGISSKLFARRM